MSSAKSQKKGDPTDPNRQIQPATHGGCLSGAQRISDPDRRIGKSIMPWADANLKEK
jgi:hypothetical protein